MSTKKICHIAQIFLNVLGYPNAELSILIVDDFQMSKMNTKYLDREGSTNVIAFPMFEGDYQNINLDLMGDVVVSVDTAKRESSLMNTGFFQRFIELLIHGILHLIGYDHLKSKNDSIEMDKMSEELLMCVKDQF